MAGRLSLPSLLLVEDVPLVEPTLPHLFYRNMRNYRRIVPRIHLREEIVLKGQLKTRLLLIRVMAFTHVGGIAQRPRDHTAHLFNPLTLPSML